MTEVEGRLRYLPQLDGLRALAISLVVGYHLGTPVTWGGFLGVGVFLVLSGLLITSILTKERQSNNRIDLSRFWLRRLLRLFPALFAVAVAAVVLSSRIKRPGDESQIVLALAALAYTANLFIAFGDVNFGGLDHTWSLALKEQFVSA